MKKKIFIFQQREWHNRIGKYLAKKLLDDNYSLACLTFKKNVNQRINEQYKDYYENIISHDDIIENPKKYINKKNENLSLQEISKNLCDCDLWQIIQSARNHVKSYKKKFYYSFSQNKDDKEIINYLRALYCTAEYVYENFKPDIIFTPNFVSLPHIVFNLYFKKKNIPMFGTADCKVAAKDIFIYDYLHTDSNFIRYLESNKNYEATIDEDKLILEIIENYKNDQIKRKYLFISEEYRFFKNYKRFFLRFLREAFDSLTKKNINRLKGIGPTIDDKNFFIVIRDFLTFIKNIIFEKFFIYDEIPENSRFTFFTLQVQPEASLDVLAPLFNNQIETARQIAMQLPADMALVVKDHPDMHGRRSVSYLNKIKNIPNVKLVNFREESSKILLKSELLIASTGSIIMESAIFKKHCLQLGELGTTLYLPNVFKRNIKLNMVNQIEEILKKNLDDQTYLDKLKNYILAGLKTGHDSDVHRNAWEINKKIDHEKFYKLIKDQIEILTKNN
jgi:hypothetical protein